jgi:hypothetical protein
MMPMDVLDFRLRTGSESSTGRVLLDAVDSVRFSSVGVCVCDMHITLGKRRVS